MSSTRIVAAISCLTVLSVVVGCRSSRHSELSVSRDSVAVVSSGKSFASSVSSVESGISFAVLEEIEFSVPDSSGRQYVERVRRASFCRRDTSSTVSESAVEVRDTVSVNTSFRRDSAEVRVLGNGSRFRWLVACFAVFAVIMMIYLTLKEYKK